MLVDGTKKVMQGLGLGFVLLQQEGWQHMLPARLDTMLPCMLKGEIEQYMVRDVPRQVSLFPHSATFACKLYTGRPKCSAEPVIRCVLRHCCKGGLSAGFINRFVIKYDTLYTL